MNVDVDVDEEVWNSAHAQCEHPGLLIYINVKDLMKQKTNFLTFMIRFLLVSWFDSALSERNKAKIKVWFYLQLLNEEIYILVLIFSVMRRLMAA